MIQELIQLGEPVEHRGVVVCPVFPRRTPHAAYVTLEEALPLGFRITEVDEAGAVPELKVVNPLEENVLLYDGEELLGAKQNRILNVTVLVAATSETRIPVSCVEQGRWALGIAVLSAAPHASHPELRRRKAEALAAQPLAPGVAQCEVWEAVDETASLHAVNSPTGAQADIFWARADDLAKLRTAFPLQPGQCGAVFAAGDDLCLDYVSRPDAFTRLYPKLLDGYLLDALARLDRKPADDGELQAFTSAVAKAPGSRRPSVALGEDVRLRSESVVGSGLELDGELIQLSAYSSEAARPSTRIVRRSRRA
jgi:hypothetical protein